MSCDSSEAIAIVGSACRFAGSSSPSQLWDILRNPIDLRADIPDSRFSAKGFYHPKGSYHGHSNVKHAYLLDKETDLSAFDAEFFRVKPVEAKALDPQQRFLLEIVFEALESAGLTIAGLEGSDTAVYVGSMFDDYATMILRDVQTTPTYFATGTGRSLLANRISYYFDWHGPSISIDTACSSSLVAVHMAVQALRAGESRTALACGTNLILGPENFIIESKLGMLSPDGRSRMWDQGANGYARGEGVAALVLKTVKAALEDGDHIECIIRETGVGQDGSTQGITVPSVIAQETLIRKTYDKAGLDLTIPQDRPQFFEAHGTGTQAGDPVEAEAVYRVFGSSSPDYGTDPLFVGSIKTIVGHTEGTAGVAAILKASLALQNASIPPNLLFERVSNRVAPFYKNIAIPQSTRPWPVVAEGGKRRVSVNSFGYGGTNAHAILESHDNVKPQTQNKHHDGVLFTPFVFSAFSKASLEANFRRLLQFLATDSSNVNPWDLAWTLSERRSRFAWRTAISSSSLEDLCTKIQDRLDAPNTAVKALPQNQNRILGIFTGQGAQYVRMGAELIQGSRIARTIIQTLDSYLRLIPGGESPAWSLESELLADEPTSRVSEAAFSQPLCTAIQILIVDLLQLAGIHFDVVVGHSSGEIAAAYAAGFLTAQDAIMIAYLRGIHLQHTSKDAAGAMMAVETTQEDAIELISDSIFNGRLWLAAVNSPSSVTISGYEDAISELTLILQDEEIPHRRLRVDKAYHSAQMRACYEPYVTSLRRCGLGIRNPSSNNTCIWYSSVFNDLVNPSLPGLADTYWAENLTRPVLFSQALTRALEENPCHLVLEVGPHPSLRTPARNTIFNVLKENLPYSGTLARQTNAAEAMSSTLGFLWSHLSHSHLNLSSYEQAMNNHNHQARLVKNLPTYSWNHDTKHWYEPRSSRKTRRQSNVLHPLLGHVTPDSGSHCITWRHLLRTNEMTWLLGHLVQNQVVFPAAGYISTAIEAARCIVGSFETAIHLIEIRDFVITQPIFFDEKDEGVEVLISMGDIDRRLPERITAKFTYAAAMPLQHADDLILAASCNVSIILGDCDSSVLPAREPDLPHMISVETERFYSSLADLGYGFRDRFRALSELQRKHNTATGLVTAGDSDNMFIHPADLDAALQSIILAHSYPYDGRLSTLHLPTKIRCMRINPALFPLSEATSGGLYPVEATVSPQKPDQRDVVGNVNLYTTTSTKSHVAMQIQETRFVPISGAAAAGNDRTLYSREHWVPAMPDGLRAEHGIIMTDGHADTVQLLERMAVYYLGQFDRAVSMDHPKRSQFPTNHYLNFARQTIALVRAGRHRRARKEWLNDSLDSILTMTRPLAHLPDVEIMHLVGTHMPRVFHGDVTMLEVFRSDGNDILDRCYSEAFGLKESSDWVSRSVKQITERYSQMNILEVGAGTGGATRAVFREIGRNFRSYTYTDISAAFFDKAASNFSRHRDKMVFKTLDLEKTPLEQGFSEGAYDLVIAFFVIHATADLSRSLRHIRKLVKPGGYLVVGEGLDVEGQCTARSGFIFGTLPGWWHGVDTGRSLSPHATPVEWDELLRSTGWSGIDSSPPEHLTEMLDVFHFVTQAVDERIAFLREPLSNKTPKGLLQMTKLAVLGGLVGPIAKLTTGLKAILASRENSPQIKHFQSLMDIDYSFVDEDCTVISFTELDFAVFQDITEERFIALKRVFENAKTLLWITSGRLADNPFSNMSIGFGRTAANEMPDLHVQQLELVNPLAVTAETVAEIVLRLCGLSRAPGGLLWSFEPEIVIDLGGRHLISRLRMVPELNRRYNSAFRYITQEVDVSTTRFVAHFDSGLCTLLDLPHLQGIGHELGEAPDQMELQITHSSLSAVSTPAGPMFLMIGNEIATGISHIALTSSLGSVVYVPSELTAPVPELDLEKEQLVTSVFTNMVAARILSLLEAGQTLVAHNTPEVIAMALDGQNTGRESRVVYTTNAQANEAPASWVRIPRYISESEIQARLHGIKPSCFISFSADDSHTLASEQVFVSAFRAHCRIWMSRKMFYSSDSPEKWHKKPPNIDVVGALLRSALHYSQKAVQPEKMGATMPSAAALSLSHISRATDHPDHLSVIDWTGSEPVPVQIRRLDSSPMFRSNNSTYWIVGMTRALGISLADWMIDKGATTLVVTSRKPDIAAEWVTAHRRRGIQVCILPCDVTDGDALRKVYEEIHETLPPVQGVIHGAMVLRDTSIKNMTYSQFVDVVRPKVNGGINLDRLFHDIDLDFMVFVSSVNCVVGNVGQGNYAAANTFLCGLAAQRRKRGLRAAAVNIGAVIGAGYLERESRRELDSIVQRLNLLRLSEEDWHQSICEAINAARLDLPYGPELTIGLADVPYDTALPPQWYSNPRFSSFLITEPSLDEKVDNKAVTTVEDLLQQCQSKEDLQQVVQSSFSAQMRTVLQVTTSDENLMASRGGEIGLDSLISVDIRSWFLRHLSVNVPVLKIMGNDTLGNLVGFVVDRIPSELVPGLTDTDKWARERQISDVSEASSVQNDASSEALARLITVPDTNLNSQPAEVPMNGSAEIDWNSESHPPTDMLRHIPVSSPRSPRFPPRVIVLTGYTGLLGRHLSIRLLAEPAVEKVICLAVRCLPSRLERGILLQDPRIVFYEGDLTQTNLGLSEEEVALIFNDADVVIHNGSDTSHLKHYLGLRAANVNSTTFLACLCIPRQIPLHYMSSAGVGIFHEGSGAKGFPPGPVKPRAQWQPDGSFGYICGKWVCERLLERTSRLHGLRVCIHRPSTIIREGTYAIGEEAEKDWVNALLTFVNKMRTVPKVERNQGVLDLVYVNNVCEDIAGQLFHKPEQEDGSVRYVHEVGDLLVPLNKLSLIGMKEPHDIPYKELPVENWVAMAVMVGMHPAVGALITEMAEGEMEYPKLLKDEDASWGDSLAGPS
ncbi:putative PKS-like protein biosynthetic cluster [Neopestalotiopsis sp. 37M]|nr:putative PKS-like protein biosynthetic cluster [Neopestalotiopsis sp. 37M]